MVHALLALAACEDPSTSGGGTVTDTGTTGGGSDGPPVHSGAPNLEITGLTGSIALVEWPPDAAHADTTTFARGLFVTDAGGIWNLASCLFASGLCTADPGGPGSTLAPADTTFLGSVTYADAGSELTAGGPLARSFAYGVPIYAGEPPYPGGTELAWDGDLAAYHGSGGFVYAGSMALTSPDPTRRIALGAGGTVDLLWTPGGVGEVFLRVGSELRHLVDDGQETVSAAEMELSSPVDTALLILSRSALAEVDADGNDVFVQTTSDQWLYVDYADTEGWTELKLGSGLAETCPEASALRPVAPGRYFGDLTDAADDHDLGVANPVTGWPSAGKDGVFLVSLAAGQTLDLVYTQPAFNAAVYVLGPDCEVSAALAGSDDGADGDPEHLVVTPATAGDLRVVLDGYYAGGPWSLEVSIR